MKIVTLNLFFSKKVENLKTNKKIMRQNKRAYSIIVIIILIWFMILLTTGVFRLVLNEMKDNSSIWNYAKAYIWAESAQEIALLNIKEKWYGFNEGLDENNELIWIPDNKTPKIKYTNNWQTKSYLGKIEPLKYNIMPLFYIKKDWTEVKIEDYKLSIISWDSGNFSWNIVWKEAWISWLWTETTKWTKKIVNSNSNIDYEDWVLVNDFLSSSDTNYLILFNNSNADIDYKITSNKDFTKPILDIISSSSIKKYKQNLKTTINYADIVNRSKYSIYSWK